MDKFKIPLLEKEENKAQVSSLEEMKEQKKLYECAQFECLPRYLGKAIAMKNYWIYRHDSV